MSSNMALNMSLNMSLSSALLSLATLVVLQLGLVDIGQASESNSESQDIPELGVTEKLGGKIPLDLQFVDENGKSAPLSEWIKKPTLLLFVYYRCPVACNMMQTDLASSIKKMTIKPGEDYQVLSISFDDQDTPKSAMEKKLNYLNVLGPDFPKDQWKFLSGNKQVIDALTGAAGYQFKKADEGVFIHPNVLITVAPDGTIIRYIYGPEFLPFDMAMSLSEASRGTPGTTIRKMLSYCFSYDSKGRKYVLDTMKIAATSILIGLGLFGIFLTRKDV